MNWVFISQKAAFLQKQNTISFKFSNADGEMTKIGAHAGDISSIIWKCVTVQEFGNDSNKSKFDSGGNQEEIEFW
jgi:hypothetical protein